MPPEISDTERLSNYLMGLLGPDPYAQVYHASHEHRESHGQGCMVFPSDPSIMRLVSLLVRSSQAKRILEIGCGLGYSALWLAEASGLQGNVDTIENDPSHIRIAQQHIASADFTRRIHVHTGEVEEVIPKLSGPYDFVYEDVSFVEQPPYIERMLSLIRPGGLLVMANWYPLEDAILGVSRDNLTRSYGTEWADRIQSFAHNMASNQHLEWAFSMQPLLGLAVKTG